MEAWPAEDLDDVLALFTLEHEESEERAAASKAGMSVEDWRSLTARAERDARAAGQDTAGG